jgi:hypothetical protein
MPNSYLVLCNNQQCMHRHGCATHQDNPSKHLIYSYTQVIVTDMGYDCADFEFLTAMSGRNPSAGFV